MPQESEEEMTEKDAALIDEAREHLRRTAVLTGGAGYEEELIALLADRLAALTAPQEGDVRERLAKVIAPDDWKLADAPQYAHLPQAARDGLTRRSLEIADAILAAFPALARGIEGESR